jgi:hypothetical protein
MAVTVTPPASITVRVGSVIQPRIQSTSTFVGGSSLQPEIQAAFDTANSASSTSNTAILYANTAYTEANTAYLYANTAYSEANTAYVLANNALPLTGGTVTGNLKVAGAITGKLDAGTF